jgi:hypothetical protein
MPLSNVVGAFVARALFKVDLDGKSPAAVRDLAFLMHNLFRIFHPPQIFSIFFKFSLLEIVFF